MDDGRPSLPPSKSIEKNFASLSSKSYPIQVWVSLEIYMCLLQCLVTCKGCYIILWAVLKVACPMKANALYIMQVWVSSQTYIYISIAVVSHLWRSLRHIVSYSKGWMPYEGECTVYCECPKKSMYLPKKVCRFSRPFQLTLLSNRIGSIWDMCPHSPFCHKGRC